jgi:hypothetical protein
MSEVKSNGKRKQRFAKVAKKSTDSTNERKKSSLEAAAAEFMKKQHQTQPQGSPPHLNAMKALNRLSMTDSEPLVDSVRSGTTVTGNFDSSLATKNMWSAKKNLLKSVRVSPRPVRKESQISLLGGKARPQPDIDVELDCLFK